MKKVALIFPGTGSQYKGMFKRFYEEFSVVQDTFEEASELLDTDMARFCFDDMDNERTNLALLQASILVTSVSAYRVFVDEVGIRPDFAAGHSVGEFSALACAGVLDFKDALHLVWQRGSLMQAAVPSQGGVIVAVTRLSHRVVEQALSQLSRENSEVVEIACYNALDQIVLSGHTTAVMEFADKLRIEGGHVTKLNVEVPFHSPIMKSASRMLKGIMQRCDFHQPQFPVISNVTALPHATSASEVANHLSLQLTSTVRWYETVRYLQSQGVGYAVEVGPNTVLSKLNRGIARNITSYAMDRPDEFAAIRRLAESRPSFIGRCLGIAVSTKNRNKDSEEYQSGVLQPYRRILELYVQTEQVGIEPTVGEVGEAYKLLQDILRIKHLADTEMESHLGKLLEETGREELRTVAQLTV